MIAASVFPSEHLSELELIILLHRLIFAFVFFFYFVPPSIEFYLFQSVTSPTDAVKHFRGDYYGVTTSTLAMWLRFNEGTGNYASDSSQNGNDATGGTNAVFKSSSANAVCIPQPQLTPSGCPAKSSSDGFVSFHAVGSFQTTTSTLPVNTQSFSMEVWVRRMSATSATVPEVILGIGGTNNTAGAYLWMGYRYHRMSTGFYSDSIEAPTNTPVITDQVWYHCVFTVGAPGTLGADATKHARSLYENGVLLIFQQSSLKPLATPTSPQTLTVGKGTATSLLNWQGDIDGRSNDTKQTHAQWHPQSKQR